MRSTIRTSRPDTRASWLAFILVIAGCAGPMAVYSAIRPVDQDAYEEHVMYTAESERDAFLAWRAARRAQTIDEARRADDAMVKSPFGRSDREAISLGAIIYMNHCMSCHGELVDGRGRRAIDKAPAQDFTTAVVRFGVAMQRGPQPEWFAAVHDGAGPIVEYADGPSQAMPAFAGELSNEQIWLVLTYLASDRD
jgi:mono/diheme cytochrome c family protein